MVNRLTLSEDDIRYAMSNGEFGSDVISSAKTVVIVMTQDWCSQWQEMKNWIYELETGKTVDIYEIVYNREPYFKEFMSFKENRWNSRFVPYLRFYENGGLVR
jgi:hypothetical protein